MICCARVAVRREDPARVETLALRARHLVAGDVLLALELLELGNQRPPPGLELRQFLELGVGVHSAVPEGLPHLVDVIAHESGVEHDTSIIEDLARSV